MLSPTIRQKLHNYVEEGDEKLIKLLFALAKEYNNDHNTDYEFNEEELMVFEQRRTSRLSGESKTYSWEEAKELITGKKNL